MKQIVILLIISVFFNHLSAQIELEAKFNGIAKAGGKGELEVKINKKNINSFAKYQIDLPTGVNATELDSKGGNFSVENNKAKIVWVNLPSENVFNIKIKIQFQSNVSFPITLYQKFFYLENSVKKEVPGNPIVMNETLSTTETPVTTNNTTLETSNSNTHFSEKNPSNESKTIGSNVSSGKGNINAINNGSSSDNKTNTIIEKKVAENNDPQHGYTYKIQIAASAKPLENNFPNVGETEVIQHNGIYKVMLKKEFATKEEALKAREDLISKGFSGAFIVKYQNGKRVN